MRAMHTLIQQGKVLYWGTSEWSAEQLLEAYALAAQHHLTPPTMEQPEYNLFVRRKVEQEFAPLYEQHGLGLTCWSPLCSGVLTGKYNDGIPSGSRASLDGYGWLAKDILSEQGQARVEVTRQLTQIALDLGVSVTHLALAWTRCNSRVSTTILGASSVAQLRDNLAAVDVVGKLTPEVQQKIAALLQANPGLE